VIAGILAMTTSLSGVFALASFMTGQPSQALMMFVIGLVGMAILVAVDPARRKAG
jgi:hypothetical protein